MISGIEAWVTENNPKYANRIIKTVKGLCKGSQLDKTLILTKSLTAQCLHTLLLTQLSNRCTSTDISAMPISLVLSLMVLGIVRDITSTIKISSNAYPNIIVEKEIRFTR